MKIRILPLLVIGLLTLGACRGGDDNNSNSSSDKQNITLRPSPIRTLVEGCKEQELEDWFEVSYFNIQAFIDRAEIEALSAVESRRGEMDVVIDQLQGYHSAVIMAPTPSCVESLHTEVLAGMESVLNTFQRYANAEIGADELSDQVSRDLDPMKNTIDNFIQDVAPLYQVDPSTPAPQ